MRPRLIISFLRELIEILPTRVRSDWKEVDSLDKAAPTVILISGFGATRRALSVIRRRLRRDGFQVIVLALDWNTLSDSVRGLYRMAAQLSTVTLRIRKLKGFSQGKVYLVAHSAGGLVARYYVQILGGSHYCDGLITLGTPHRGTWVAGFGFLTHLIVKAACLFHMLPVSKFIKNINAAAFPSGFRMVSLSSDGDLICPPSAAELPPSLRGIGGIEMIEMKDLSHSDFLLSRKVYQVLRRVLVEDFGHLSENEPIKKWNQS